LALDEYHTGGPPSGGNHIRLATLFLGGRGKVWQIAFGVDFLIWTILVAVGRVSMPRLDRTSGRGEADAE